MALKRDDLLDALSDLDAIEQHFNDRVEVWRIVIDADGHEVRRIYRGAFTMPPDWQPPSLKTQLARAKGMD